MSNSIRVNPSPDDPGDSMQRPAGTYLTRQDHQMLYDVLAHLEDKRSALPSDVYPDLHALRLFLEATYRDEKSPTILQIEAVS